MDVEKIAKMSRLWLTAEEKERFTKDLKEVLKMFEVLKSIDVEDEVITIHPTPLSNITRVDDTKKSINNKDVFRNTQNKEEGYFKGPKIIE